MSTKKIQILNGASIIPKPDWNQTDDTKADYIKNRPFYEDTLVDITWDGDTIGKTKVDLTSVLGFNVYLMSNDTPSVEDLTGSTVTVYDGSSSMEFSVGSVQTPSDNIIIVLDGYAFVILADNSEFNGIVFPSKGTYFGNSGEAYVSRITKKVINQIDPKFINMDLFPKELLKITVTSSDSTYSADKTDSDIKSCLDNGGIPYIALYDTVFIYEGYSSDIGYIFIDTNDGKMLCIYNNSVSLYSSNLKSKLDSTVSTTAQTLTDEQKTQARTNIGGADISLGISGASAGQMAKVKAVDASGAPTSWEAGDAASGGDGWTEIGELTVEGTEFIISDYTGGVITVTPDNGIYPSIGRSYVIRKPDYSAYINARLVATETEGKFTMVNLDNAVYTPSEDLTQYVIDAPHASGELVFSNLPSFSFFKIGITTPLLSSHGSRTTIEILGKIQFTIGTSCSNLTGGAVEAIIETDESPVSGKDYVKASFKGKKTDRSNGYDVIDFVSKSTSDSIKIKHYNGLMVSGTNVKLWGRN